MAVHWHKDIRNIPRFSGSDLDQFVQENKKVKVSSDRGYKFFLEGYVHDIFGELITRYDTLGIRYKPSAYSSYKVTVFDLIQVSVNPFPKFHPSILVIYDSHIYFDSCLNKFQSIFK